MRAYKYRCCFVGAALSDSSMLCKIVGNLEMVLVVYCDINCCALYPIAHDYAMKFWRIWYCHEMSLMIHRSCQLFFVDLRAHMNDLAPPMKKDL